MKTALRITDAVRSEIALRIMSVGRITLAAPMTDAGLITSAGLMKCVVRTPVHRIMDVPPIKQDGLFGAVFGRSFHG